jgi:LysM repeat protein
VSKRPPKRPPPPKRKKPPRPPGKRSPWTYLAPAALLGAVTVIVLISSSAGWIGEPSDGVQPPSTGQTTPVETLSVPSTAPPPEPPPPPPEPAPPPPPPPPATTAETSTTGTNASTTPSTSETTTSESTTTSTDETTGSAGQHVKWTVKPGDTLSSIAAQFGTTVDELQRLNPSIDPAALQVGQTLVVR